MALVNKSLFGFGLIASGCLLGLVAIGCGGSSTSVAGISTAPSQPGGCGGVFTGASFSVNYLARSRSVASGLSSALSGQLAISGTETSVKFSRNSNLAAHSESYALPSLAVGSFTATYTFYAGASQTGAVVGTASFPIKVSCSGVSGLGAFSVTGVISKISVAPVSVTVGGATQQLSFTATDSSGNAVVVSPGSAVFSATGSAAKVTADGVVTPVSAGTIQVTATVDGVTSAPVTVTVNGSGGGSGGGTGYKVVDLGANTYVSNESSFDFYRKINDSNQCVVYDATAHGYYVTNADLPSQRVPIAGSSVSNLSIGNDGTVYGVGPAYWSPPDYSTPISPQAQEIGTISAVNVSGEFVGQGPSFGYDWKNLSATPTPLASIGILMKPNAINSSGVIVGTSEDSSFNGTAVSWANSTAQPVLIPGFSKMQNSQAVALNDSGQVLVLASPQDAYLATLGSPTPVLLGGVIPQGINNAGVYVGSTPDFDGSGKDTLAEVGSGGSRFGSLYDLCDSSKTGWTLNYANSINNNGYILGSGTKGGVSHAFVAIPLR